MDRGALYEFQVANEKFDSVIKMLLRLYGAQLFTDFIKISEAQLATGLKVDISEVKGLLKHLDELQVVTYQPVIDNPQITYILPRQDADRLPVDRARLAARKKLAEDKMQAMVDYASTNHRCRMQRILEYFDEHSWETCGLCDVCIANRKKENREEAGEIHQEILNLLSNAAMTSEELEQKINPRDVELFVDVIRELVDEGRIEYDEVWKLRIKP